MVKSRIRLLPTGIGIFAHRNWYFCPQESVFLHPKGMSIVHWSLKPTKTDSLTAKNVFYSNCLRTSNWCPPLISTRKRRILWKTTITNHKKSQDRNYNFCQYTMLHLEKKWLKILQFRNTEIITVTFKHLNKCE